MTHSLPSVKELIETLSKLIQKSTSTNIAFIGIDIKGKIIADRLAHYLKSSHNISIPTGQLNVEIYRHHQIKNEHYINIGETNIPFKLSNKTLILVTDILNSGESMRASLSALNDYEQPQEIKICCLIHKDNLKVPIFAEYTGQTIATEHPIKIDLFETDGNDEIRIVTNEKVI